MPKLGLAFDQENAVELRVDIGSGGWPQGTPGIVSRKFAQTQSSSKAIVDYPSAREATAHGL